MTPNVSRLIKTSATHPLQIHAAPAPGGGFVGMMLCPGKRQPEAATGPWDRDLEADMNVVRAFNATAVLTLMEGDELLAAAVSSEILERASLARGMVWLHLPIPDFAAPGADFETRWRVSGPLVRARLRQGEKIAIHCRGGRGRSGMIAARLLVELGLDPEAAIAEVRAVNPLAIETAVQEAHVRGCVSIHA